jgi:DNA polymerase phi
MTSTTTASLELFSHLTLPDPAARLDAAVELVAALTSTQVQHEIDTDQTKSSLRSLAPDVSYALDRLVRGLSTSSEATRQGFSVALAALLRSIPAITTDMLLATTDAHLTSSSISSRSEKRDYYFGCIFLALVLVRSHRLMEVPKAQLEALIDVLVTIASRKKLIRELAWNTIRIVIGELSPKLFQKLIVPELATIFEPQLQSVRPEAIALAVTIQEYCEQHELHVPHPRIGQILDVDNFTQLLDPMLESTVDAHPRIHVAWFAMFDYLLRKEGFRRAHPEDIIGAPGDVPYIIPIVKSDNDDTKQDKFTPAPLQDGQIPLWKQFWDATIGCGFIDATERRQYCAIRVVELLMQMVPSEHFTLLLTRPFLRMIMQLAVKRHSPVQATARYWLTFVKQLALREAPKENGVAFMITHILSGPNGSARFDMRVGMSVVHTILGHLKGSEARRHIGEAMKSFANPLPHLVNQIKQA